METTRGLDRHGALCAGTQVGQRSGHLSEIAAKEGGAGPERAHSASHSNINTHARSKSLHHIANMVSLQSYTYTRGSETCGLV